MYQLEVWVFFFFFFTLAKGWGPMEPMRVGESSGEIRGHLDKGRSLRETKGGISKVRVMGT